MPTADSGAWRTASARSAIVSPSGASTPARRRIRLTAPSTSSATSPPSLISTPRPAMLVAMVTAAHTAGPGDDGRLCVVLLRIEQGGANPAGERSLQSRPVLVLQSQQPEQPIQILRSVGVEREVQLFRHRQQR